MDVLEYINGWTKEKVIEKVKTEFKGKSTYACGRYCAYRGKGGRKCIVGLFIPDSLYLREFDLMHLTPDLTPAMFSTTRTNNFLGAQWNYVVEKFCPFKPDKLLAWQTVHDNLPDDLSLEAQKFFLLRFLDNGMKFDYSETFYTRTVDNGNET